MSTCFKPGFDYCMVKVNSSRQGGGGVNTRLRTQNHHQDKHREYKSLSDSLRANLSPHNTDTANCVQGKPQAYIDYYSYYIVIICLWGKQNT